MVIRQAVYEDLDALAAIEQSAAKLFRGTVMEFAMDDPPLDNVRLKTALSGNTLWIAEQDAVRAGFLCAHLIGTLLYIDELAVAAEYQGQGLGRALMEICIADARKRFKRIALLTDRELPWSAPFYARLGFVEWNSPSTAVAAKLEEEIAYGFDVKRRCAMLINLN